MPLKTALHNARKTGDNIRGEAVEFDQAGETKVYEIEVILLNGARKEKSDYLVLFHGPKPEGRAAPKASQISPAKRKARETREIDRLRREIATAREYLRTVTEEQEAGAEELRAANEEILSSNEELQSTNEELETAKEELQSSNEELNTLNEELQNRNRELDQLANDLSNLLTGVEIPIVILGEDLRIRRFTPPAETLLNLLPSDVGRPIHHIRPRIQVDNLDQLAAEVIAQGRVIEREVQDADGRWHSLRMKPYKTAEKKIDGAMLALVDVTRLKIAEVHALREREATISALLETAAQGILAIDRNGEMQLVNSAVERQFGYRREDLLGHSVEVLLPERYRRKHIEHRGQFFARPKQRPMGSGLELHGRRKDGSEFPIEVSLSHIPSKQGPLAIAFIADVSERRRSESELRRSEARLRSILFHSPALIYLKDLRGRYMLVNRAYEKMLKRKGSEIEGKTPFALYTRADARKYSDATKEVIRSGSSQKIEQTVRIGRRIHTLLCEEFPLKDPTGKMYGVCGICNDISERKHLEETARQHRESLRALTERLILTQEHQYSALARELHDDLSRRLAALGLKVGSFAAKPPSQAADLKAAVASAQDHIAELAESVHALSRRLHPAVLDDLGLAAAVENECRAFSQKFGVPADFRSKGVPKRLPERISLCLYRVAQESLLNVGKHADANHVMVSLSATRKEILLQIADVGDGFDTRKVRGKGGLGLVSMEERVRFAGGLLTIESQPGSGTRVEARIPLVDAARKRKVKRE